MNDLDEAWKRIMGHTDDGTWPIDTPFAAMHAELGRILATTRRRALEEAAKVCKETPVRKCQYMEAGLDYFDDAAATLEDAAARIRALAGPANGGGE